MGCRIIKWSKRSISNRDKIAEWYQNNIGRQAVINFLTDLHSTAKSVAEMPTIGIYDEVCSTEKRKYFSVLIHPKYRLIYRYTSKTVYIVGIRSNIRKNKFT